MIATTVPTKAKPPKTEASGTHYRIVCNKADRIAAFRLVYDNYLSKGLIQPNPYQLRVAEHQLLPTTTVFAADRDGQIICTVTLIGDGQLGLPMECIYPSEINAARDRGLYVGEVSALAVDDVEFRTFLPIFVELTRLMAQFARANGMDQFLIAVHPKHARFYQRFMGFEQIGGLKEYPSVQNAPAVACCLDFARIDRERPACYNNFFGVPLPQSELKSDPMTDGEREAFGHVVDVTEQCLLVTV